MTVFICDLCGRQAGPTLAVCTGAIAIRHNEKDVCDECVTWIHNAIQTRRSAFRLPTDPQPDALKYDRESTTHRDFR